MHKLIATDTLNPVILPDGEPHLGTVFLNQAIKHSQIEIGDYTYASAFDVPDDWAARLAPYLFEFSPEKLVIGKFCQIADGVTFITSSANHRYDGFSSYPFGIFSGGLTPDRPSAPEPGPDTVIGNDVWIGQGARIMPGTKIGNGVIVGAGSVVSGDVDDYSIIAGNPAKLVRKRFDDKTIAELMKLAWWDWQPEKIIENEAVICGSNINELLNLID